MQLVRDPNRLGEIANEIAQVPVVGLDSETTSLSPHHGRIRLLQLNTGRNIWLIDLFHTKTLGPVATALNDGGAVVVGQNLKFDQKFLLHHAIELWPLFDTFRASNLLHNGKGLSHDLYSIYERELGMEGHAPDMSASDWGGELSDDQLRYAAEDVEHLLVLREVMKPKLAQAGLNRTALIEFQAILPEASMEVNGFHLDREMWLELAEAARIRRDELKEQVFKELPHPKDQMGLPGMSAGWNLNSHVQKRAAIHRLGVPVENTREMTLAMHAAKYPVLRTLIAYTKAAKRVSSFGPEYLRHVDSVTGRIHTSFYPFLAAGRYSSSDPNLQQIPRSKDYRRAFAPPPGRKIVVADYSQIELRLVAQISRDRLLMEVYRKGLDAHRQTAALVNEVALSEVSRDMRQSAKPVNFGLCYGMGAEKLVLYAMSAYGIALKLEDAERFRERYFEGYSGVKEWHQRTMSQGKRTGVSRTLSGRIRYLQEDAHNEILNCVDFETEALTRRGWVRGPDLTMDDELLTKNPDTAALEWQRPTDLKVFGPAERELIEFKSRSFHALSTPDHRWLVYSKAAKRDVERVTQTISLHGDDRIHRTGRYIGPEAGMLSDDAVELAGWWLTDGRLMKTRRVEGRPGKRGPKPSGVSFRLYQSEETNALKAARIEALLGRMGIKYTKHPNGPGQALWHFRHPVTEVLAGLCPDRVLTLALLNVLTAKQCHLLMQTMIDGDGWRESKTAFVTKTREGAEAFQILCTLCGVAASIKERDMSKYRPRSSKLKNIPKGTKHWQVTLLKRDKVQVLRRHTKKVKGTFGVWCPMVPNTFFVARRSGHVFVTGNTPVQGSGADGLKASLPLVYERLKKYGGRAKLVHMVHDEIVIEADDDPEQLEAIKTDLEEGMKEGMQPFLPDVPVVVEGAYGDSWAEH